jgi:N-acetylglucosamine-6-sulfatase
VILTDDLDVSQVRFMPRLKARIADRGTTFKNSFVSDPLCAPSRSSLLTGKYAHNHGVRDNLPPLGGFKAFKNGGLESANLAFWLEKAGYRTGLLGKFLNGYPVPRDLRHVPPGWSTWFALFGPDYFDYVVNEDGVVREFGHAPADYQTDVLREKALAFLRTDDPRPFFLYVTPHAPHSPAIPAPRHEEVMNGLKAPRTPAYDEPDTTGKPRWVRDLPRMSAAIKTRTDELYETRAEALLSVDEMVEALVQALERRNVLETTYVIFGSDNGFQFGAHRIDHGKGDPYEESIRVPLLVRGPGVREGVSLEALALNIDLAPTVLDWVGLPPPAILDGRSLKPLLQGPAPLSFREDFLVESFAPADSEVPGYAALRSQTSIYIEYVTGERELYDLQKDPNELRNLVGSQPPKSLERLKARLDTLRRCHGETCGR